jgi:hypothetical protein
MPRRAAEVGREELLTAEGCLRLGVATRLLISSSPAITTLRQRKGAKNPVDVTASDDLAELPEGALTLCFEQPVALIWDFISSAPIYGQFAE